MIDRKKHPFGWSMFLYELEDAREHLGKLIKEISEDAEYDEANLRVDLGHVYAHLNRAWHRRLMEEDFLDDADRDAASRPFPTDIEPIG